MKFAVTKDANLVFPTSNSIFRVGPICAGNYEMQTKSFLKRLLFERN